MRKKLLFGLALALFSCGGDKGQPKATISLSFKQVPQVEYFSRVLLRVSWAEGEFQSQKEGKFYPGDKVVFNLDLPEGEERSLEVFLFDPQGKPLYYRSVFLQKLSKGDSITVELLPTEGTIKTYELRSDGRVEGSKEVYLFGEDLFFSGGRFEGYVAGAVAGLRAGKRAYFYYLQGKENSLEYEESYSLKVKALPSKSLYITGSAEGFLSQDSTFEAGSRAISSEGQAFLCGLEGSSLYYALGSASTSLSLISASTNTYSLLQNMSFYGTLTEYKGIRAVCGYADGSSLTVLELPGASHYAGYEISSQSECMPSGYEYINLSSSPNVKFSNFLVPSPSSWRIYSADGLYELYFECSVPNMVSVSVPYLQDRQVFVERRLPQGGYRRLLKLSGLSRWEEDGHAIKSLTVESQKDRLLIRYEKMGDFKACHLKLYNQTLEVFIRNIPPYRSYIKLSRNSLVEELFKESPGAELVCEFEGGEVYYDSSSSLALQALR